MLQDLQEVVAAHDEEHVVEEIIPLLQSALAFGRPLRRVVFISWPFTLSPEGFLTPLAQLRAARCGNCLDLVVFFLGDSGSRDR